ncbi:MAG: DUF2247 family protein [Polyangiaceae bacterium]|nr:DUF2247 family protein [Myxococcales bacterium]MCB9584948.1 DUF2247 family protein [Polyangiaceae bacterium]MCB9607479.1 DUF2247 family protein [Polyangiaceae bacterium]
MSPTQHSFDLPAELVLSVPWTWQSLAWGLQKGLIGRVVAIQAATRLLAQGEPASAEVVELAGCAIDDPLVEQLVTRLARDQAEAGAVDEPWLYLVLRWVYDNQTRFADPLQVVDEVYADFDYPAAISSFVRYMPSDSPDLGGEGNTRHLYARWLRFLEEEERRLTGVLEP